jgi:hypothetical protein
LSKKKSLVEKRYSFCQEIKILPRRDIGFAKKNLKNQK